MLSLTDNASQEKQNIHTPANPPFTMLSKEDVPRPIRRTALRRVVPDEQRGEAGALSPAAGPAGSTDNHLFRQCKIQTDSFH
jgi:hypothetical protein